MRHAQPFGVLMMLALVAGCLVPAAAQSPARAVSDAQGLFSISLPSDWTVADSQMSDVVFSGLQKTPLANRIISRLAAHSAIDDGGAPAILAVAAVSLPAKVSPVQFGEALRVDPPAEWTVTQDGRAAIAGRDAYYIYFTAHRNALPLYMVMVYFTVGRTGFLVVGGTINDADSIRRHFATISRILETFRPTDKLGAVDPR